MEITTFEDFDPYKESRGSVAMTSELIRMVERGMPVDIPIWLTDEQIFKIKEAQAQRSRGWY